MKTIKITFLLALVALIGTSCSNNNDEPEKTVKNLLIGTWQFVESTTNGVKDTDVACDILGTLTITKNKVSATNFSGNQCESPETNVFEYSVEGNTMTINDEGDIILVKIVTLNDTTLKIEIKEDGETDTTTYRRK